ncbi:hypothetical protein RRG08_020847 [Elysia crispata]|uniref:Uncharacterized protein n=1 Tax=Elysia crispata TaxID=231223 RepID=A0AAE1CN47_9GAST|nr:hypothetical protein RRG08_020847 [Elysia crispata]
MVHTAARLQSSKTAECVPRTMVKTECFEIVITILVVPSLASDSKTVWYGFKPLVKAEFIESSYGQSARYRGSELTVAFRLTDHNKHFYRSCQ